MAYIWSASSFNYYSISFDLKYIHGSTYINSGASAFSEAVAYFMGGVFSIKLGARKALAFNFAIGLAGSLALVFIDP